MFKELKRAIYRVKDLEAARSWYSRVLEAAPVFDSPVACIFHVGGGSLTLAPAPARAAPCADSSSEDRPILLYWAVEDVDRAFARLLELGATPRRTPENVLTVRVAEVADPFGIPLGLCGRISSDERQTIEHQPSETAHGVALCRALLDRDPRPEIRRPDPFSQLFLKEEARPMLDDPAKCQAVLDRRISRPLYGFLAARTGFFDDAFAHALAAHVPQIVQLGAGYDTRALRFARSLGATRVFEVDAPSTQGRKTTLLQRSGTPLPPGFAFVAVNFKTDDFVERLSAAGYEPSAPTLFLWEGVTYYLPIEVVEATLTKLYAASAPGSELLFDYVTEKVESLHAGEPMLSLLDPETLPQWLERFGFRVVEHLAAPELAARYLSLSDGSIAERPLARLRVVSARRFE